MSEFDYVIVGIVILGLMILADNIWISKKLDFIHEQLEALKSKEAKE